MIAIMIDIDFFDDPEATPHAREDVRFKRLKLLVRPPDGRRIGVNFEITPFIERPSIEVTAVNARSEPAGTLTVVQTMQANFGLTLHLRDREPTAVYRLTATLYYASPELGRMDVHRMEGMIDISAPPQEYLIE